MTRSRRARRRGGGSDGTGEAVSLTGGLVDGLPAWRVAAAFDAAKTTDLNRRHWQDADNLSADVRRVFP